MAATKELVLGIDASTTACKAIVWSLQGEALAEGRASLPLLKPRPLWHEQPADAWWQATRTAIRAALRQLRAPIEQIRGLCIAPQRETFVPVDEQGKPLRPAIIWMDERCRALLPEIASTYGAARLHAETGKPLSGNLTLGKIAWLRKHQPEVFARTARYLDVAAFLIHRLTGAYHTGWGCVDPTGLFDMQADTWCTPLLDTLGVTPEQFPRAFPPGAVTGTLHQRAAEACGLWPGLPVIAGVGDGQAGGLGVGITEPGEAYLNLGTAVVSGTYSARYLTDRAFRTMYGGIPGSYSLETVLLSGTYIVTWFLDYFAAEGGEDPAEMLARFDTALDEIPIGAEGLLLVPYWNGALSPYWDADASGIAVGWRGIHTPEHLYRAILEGIAFEQRLHSEGVEAALDTPMTRFVAMGGGSRNERWCQIIADVTGKPVARAATPEAAALGAGILSAAGAGLFPDVQRAAQAMTHIEPRTFLPDPGRQARYTALYEEVYRQLFPALRPYLDRLTALAEAQRVEL